MEENMKADGVKVLSGEDAFKLYDTYGFPVDLTAEILEEKGFTYDEAGFESCMEAQRQKARGARKETNYMGADANVYNDIDSEITTEFTGYDKLTDTAEIAFLTTSDDVVEALSDGDKGSVIVPNTPFYATMGGQQGDKGIIKTESGTFVVEDTVKVVGNRYAHVGYVSEGMIRTGEKATLSVDTKTRTNTCRNHSATHLLQKALREVLGTHVEQAGSYQDAERTRFDFSHFSAMTAEELKRVEDIVNEKINEAIEVRTDIMTVDEAKKTGAMALFGEKYGVAIINDIAAGEMDDDMFRTVADLNVPYIMMHMQGTPQNMQQHPHYDNLLKEVFMYFARKVQQLRDLGVKDIILDPGFGFGKTIEHNYELLAHLEEFRVFELPLLVGVSRKSMIYRLLGTTPQEALNGTTVLDTICLLKGADILRVHDVREAVETVKIVEAMNAPRSALIANN
jgi:dihydropteroate synthase